MIVYLVRVNEAQFDENGFCINKNGYCTDVYGIYSTEDEAEAALETFKTAYGNLYSNWTIEDWEVDNTFLW